MCSVLGLKDALAVLRSSCSCSLTLTPTTFKNLTKPCRAWYAKAQPSLPAVSGKPSGSLSSQDKHPHSCVPSLALVAVSASQPFNSSFHTLTHLYTLSHTHVLYSYTQTLYHPHICLHMPCDPLTHMQIYTGKCTLPLTHLSHTQTTLSYTHAHSPTRVYTLTYMTALSALTSSHTTAHACSYFTDTVTHFHAHMYSVPSHIHSHMPLQHHTHTVTYSYAI